MYEVKSVKWLREQVRSEADNTYLLIADMSNDVVACIPLQLVYRKWKMLAVSCFSSGASRDGFHFLLKDSKIDPYGS
jgi:hypothetical protein